MVLSNWNYFYTLTDQHDQVNRIVFSPDGLSFASSGFYDSYIYYWSVKDGTLIKKFIAPFGSVNDISFSPDGKLLAAGCEDKTTRVFSTSDGKLVDTLEGHQDEVWRVAFSKDGRFLASASNDCTIKLFGVYRMDLKHEISLDEKPRTIAFYPNDHMGNAYLLSISTTGILQVWDLSTGKLSDTLDGRTHSDVFDISITSDSRYVACPSYSSIYLWDLFRKQFVGEVFKDNYFIWSLAFDPNGLNLALAREDGSVIIYDLINQTILNTLRGHTKRVYCVTFSNDGQFLASGSLDHTVRLWRRNNL